MPRSPVTARIGAGEVGVGVLGIDVAVEVIDLRGASLVEAEFHQLAVDDADDPADLIRAGHGHGLGAHALGGGFELSLSCPLFAILQLEIALVGEGEGLGKAGGLGDLVSAFSRRNHRYPRSNWMAERWISSGKFFSELSASSRSQIWSSTMLRFQIRISSCGSCS